MRRAARPGDGLYFFPQSVPPGPTRMASTPSGGAHIYFRESAGGDIRNSAGRLGPGLDVRAHGGYVVAPPSVIDGKAYRWDITERAKVLPDAWANAMQPPKPQRVPVELRPRIGSGSRYGLAVLNGEADAVARRVKEPPARPAMHQILLQEHRCPKPTLRLSTAAVLR